MSQTPNNLLRNTRAYLVGHMQYSCGRSWRETVAAALNPRGIITFDPYLKPFIKDLEEASKEDESLHERCTKLLQEDRLGEVQAVFEKIRQYDLSLVDRADFIIANLEPKVASWGSAEELSRAKSGRKAAYIHVVGGRKAVPFWLLAMFPEQCFYNSMEEIVETILALDSGTKEIPHDIWRLLALPKI
jgi:hypothetical protein